MRVVPVLVQTELLTLLLRPLTKMLKWTSEYENVVFVCVRACLCVCVFVCVCVLTKVR
jgi:hypothetical protein